MLVLVNQGQSIADLVIQHYGSLNYMIKFCSDNNLSVDADLVAGSRAYVDETVGKKTVKDFYSLNAIEPNNGQAIVQKPTEESDLDILRQIRDANPSSTLTGNWSESRDPYTQWTGVAWNESRTKVTTLQLFNDMNIKNMPNIHKLKGLISVSISNCNISTVALIDMPNLKSAYFRNDQIKVLTLQNLINVVTVYASFNQLEDIDLSTCPAVKNLLVSNNKLKALNASYCKSILTIYADYNEIADLNVADLRLMYQLFVQHNLLVTIPSLTDKYSLAENYYGFEENKITPAEVDRLVALGLNRTRFAFQS